MEALATVPTAHGDCHCARFLPSAEFASAAFPERDRLKAAPHPYAAQERLEEPSLLMARARSKQQILRAQI